MLISTRNIRNGALVCAEKHWDGSKHSKKHTKCRINTAKNFLTHCTKSTYATFAQYGRTPSRDPRSVFRRGPSGPRRFATRNPGVRRPRAMPAPSSCVQTIFPPSSYKESTFMSGKWQRHLMSVYRRNKRGGLAAAMKRARRTYKKKKKR